MERSNFSELRRVRSEMSKAAGHSALRYVNLLSACREKYRDRLVNHGAESPASPASPDLPFPRSLVSHTEAEA